MPAWRSLRSLDRTTPTLLLLAVAACGGDDRARDAASDAVADSVAVDDVAVDSADTTAPDADTTAPDADTTDATAPAARIDFPTPGHPVDLTPDGGLALLQDSASPRNALYFVDTRSGVVTRAGETGDFERPALAVASTGRIAAFHGDPIQAAYLDPDRWHDLGSPYAVGCDANLGSAFDIRADGHEIVGMLWHGCATDAFLWGEDVVDGDMDHNLPTILPHLGDGDSNRATKIADDGSLIGGFASGPGGSPDRTPAIWHSDHTGELLDPTQTVTGEVLSVSADGSRVAGVWDLAGFTWTAAGGVVMLGALPTSLPSDPTFPNAIGADARLVFGGQGDAFAGTIHAFVWDATHGMRALEDVARAAGVTLPDGWWLGNVIAASTDGSVVLGSAFELPATAPAPIDHTFVLHLPLGAYDLD